MIGYVKVFTKNPVDAVMPIINAKGKYDLNNYYLFECECNEGVDYHYKALQHVRKYFDANACGTQSAEEAEIANGKIIQITY